MKNILICLEQIGIGGVETAVITQAGELSRRGYNVFVAARKGVLLSKLEIIENVTFIEYDFVIENYIEEARLEQLEKIILDNKIELIYCHQFPCAPYIVPIHVKHSIPYITYSHNINFGGDEWFMETYDIYKTMLPFYFQYANINIAITEKVKKENQRLYHIPDNKYIVIPNSLDFTSFDKIHSKKKNERKKMALVSAFWHEKRDSYITALEYYKRLKEEYADMTLKVIGDGIQLEEVKEEYKDLDIEFIGGSNKVVEEIKDVDIVLGVDRCILEAVASKKIAVICSYNKTINVVTPTSIKKACEENFSGKNFDESDEDIFKYSDKQMKDMIEKNYTFIKDKFDIQKTMYIDINQSENYHNLDFLVKALNDYSKKTEDLDHLKVAQEQEAARLFHETQELYKQIHTLEEVLEKERNLGLKGLIRKLMRKIFKPVEEEN